MTETTKLCPKCSDFNEIDAKFCKHCGFTVEELDFIINYDSYLWSW